MPKQPGKSVNVLSDIDTIQALAIRSEVRKVPVYLSDEQTHEVITETISILDTMEAAKENFQEVKREYNDQTKEYKRQLSLLNSKRRKGYSEEESTCYDVPDHDSAMMVTYNDKGQFVGQRRLTPQEQQLDNLDDLATILTLPNKTGTR